VRWQALALTLALALPLALVVALALTLPLALALALALPLALALALPLALVVALALTLPLWVLWLSMSGFAITFLPKLSYLKSGNLKTAFLRYLIDFMESQPLFSSPNEGSLLSSHNFSLISAAVVFSLFSRQESLSNGIKSIN
jgi:hypothetical protein